MVNYLIGNVWKSVPSVPPELLPDFVAQVAKAGGRYVVFEDDYISVQDAIENKTRADTKLLQIKECLIKCRSKLYDAEEVSREMRQAAEGAGRYFFWYLYFLNFLRRPNLWPEIPPSISKHHELKERWEKGFQQERSKIYRS